MPLAALLLPQVMAYIAAMSRARTLFCCLSLLAMGLLPCFEVSAHPEDEFCVPGEGGLDPALCDALSKLDSADADSRSLDVIVDIGGRSALETVGLYVTIGTRHILPDGLDHILFVLALFLSSVRLRPLIVQVSMFTVAHTVTLALAAVGLIALPSAIVEAVIAASIAFVAIENLVLKDLPKWRPLLVFVFGLVHGLGFAGFFAEIGLPRGQFWSSLIGFNIGVELGQLTVIAIAFALTYPLRRWLGARGNVAAYHRWVVVPASLGIGIVGLWWTLERSAAALA